MATRLLALAIQTSLAWKAIAMELVRGKTVSQTVAAWNNTVEAPFEYTFVGDGNVTIAGVRTQ